ncbi:MAG: hypothetical protein IKD55_05075 [Sediminibacterium sp.]|nr:hypothetical protein [Sediminibacterium sp.]
MSLLVFLVIKEKSHGRDSKLLQLFYSVLIYKCLFHGILVDVLRILSNGAVNREYGVKDYELFYITLIEFSSNIVYLAVFLILRRIIAFGAPSKSLKSNEIYILTTLSLLSSISYVIPGIFNSFFWFINPLLIAIGPISSVILTIWGIKNRNNYNLAIGLTNIILTFLINMIAGLRGAIVGILVLLVILSIIELNAKTIKKYILYAFIPVTLLYFVQTKLGPLKYAFAISVANKSLDLQNPMSYINFINDFINGEIINETDFEAVESSFINDVEFRYGAASMFAVGFLRMYNNGYIAQLKIESNTIKAFMPRQIIGDDKPVSGSLDGTEKTMGMYACYNEITGDNHNMTDFYVSGHYYWQFGFFGVFLFSFVASIFSFSIYFLSKGYELLGQAFWLLSFKPFWFLPKIWMAEAIIMSKTQFFPLGVVLFSFIVLHKIKNIGFK